MKHVKSCKTAFKKITNLYTLHMKRKIDVTDDIRKRLAEIFRCSEKMVYLALTFQKDTELAQKIRFVAVEQYHGVPMVMCTKSDCRYFNS
jgi:hypothetical protein